VLKSFRGHFGGVFAYFLVRIKLSTTSRIELSRYIIDNNKMESLSETQWDVLIEGTGLQQSLLAL
jgi:hypothetical protein